MTLTVGSLFAGIGGMDLGLERAGMTVRWQVEIDSYCQKVLAKHWPAVRRYSDVKDVGAHNLEPVDLICGGFPCQDISNAGKRAGIDGERSGLWSEFARIIRELRPRYVLVENVAALLGRGIGRVLGDLAQSGYDAEWDCIPAAAVGAPHRRDRVWILAYSRSQQYEGGSVTVSGTITKVVSTDANAERQLQSQGRKQKERGWISNGSETIRNLSAETAGRNEGQIPVLGGPICNAAISRLPHRPIFSLGESGTHPQLERSDWWATEPNVCMLADGISQGLDRGLNGNAVNVNEASLQATQTILRVLRDDKESSCPSRGWRSDGQLTDQLADALRRMSHLLALGERQATVATTLGYLSRLRQACETIGALRNPSDSITEAWSSLSSEEEIWVVMAASRGPWWAEWPEVPRIAQGIPSRVDRLKGLGNAVVPQVAQFIGERIMEAHANGYNN